MLANIVCMLHLLKVEVVIGLGGRIVEMIKYTKDEVSVINNYCQMVGISESN